MLEIFYFRFYYSLKDKNEIDRIVFWGVANFENLAMYGGKIEIQQVITKKEKLFIV